MQRDTPVCGNRDGAWSGLVSRPPPARHTSTPTSEKLWEPGASFLGGKKKQKPLHFRPENLGCQRGRWGGEPVGAGEVSLHCLGAPHPDANAPARRPAAPPLQTRPIARRQDTPPHPARPGGGPTAESTAGATRPGWGLAPPSGAAPPSPRPSAPRVTPFSSSPQAKGEGDKGGRRRGGRTRRREGFFRKKKTGGQAGNAT